MEYHTPPAVSTNREATTGYGGATFREATVGEVLDSPSIMLRKRLTAFRTDRGLAQEEVARRAGVGGTALSNWEQLKRDPSLDVYARWAKALGFELIVDLEPLDSPRMQILVDRRHAELLKTIDLLTPSQVAAISAIVDEFIR